MVLGRAVSFTRSASSSGHSCVVVAPPRLQSSALSAHARADRVQQHPPDAAPLQSSFWRSDRHEVDFIRRDAPWIEVKAGKASPFEFDWFGRTFPRERLLVVNAERFESQAVRGVTLEDFLLDETL